MLLFNLQPIFQARGIDNPYPILVKAGISKHSAKNIVQGITRVMNLDHIEILCKILICEPNDLLVWQPTKGEVYPENLPLFNIWQPKQADDLTETIATIPFKELKEVTQTIIENRKTNM